MVYRERQGLSPLGDPIQSSNNRDRYLDNCFLLCLNRDDDTDIPEIHRLENNLMRDLCKKNPIKSHQQSRLHVQDQQVENYDFDDDDDEDIRPSKQQQEKDRDYYHRRKGNQQDRDFHTMTNRSRYPRDDGTHSYYTHDQYSRTSRYNHRDEHNSDDELSVYEVYVPTNTLNRLSDKRIDNNMVLIDYEDVSMLRDRRGPSSSYPSPQRNITSQYNNYTPVNQYGADYGPQYQSSGFPREHNGQQQYYQNNPIQQQQQQRPGGYYENQGDRQPYSPQSGPFLPTNIPTDHSNAINVRRHIYSPSQLPQGLTEGQLVMLLQKGNQYQQIKSPPTVQQTQLFPTQQEPQPSTTSAVTVSHQPSPVPSAHVEPFQPSEYVPPPPPPPPHPQVKISQPPPQIFVDHRPADEDKNSVVTEMTKPMSTLHTLHPSKDIESKSNGEKKKDKTSDLKKDKKDAGGSSSKKDSKKDGKKEKSSGKDEKKKKK